MKTISLRRAIVAAVAVIGVAALAGGAAFAQPNCGGVASLMNKQIYQLGIYPKGWNIVSVPVISPLNVNPTDTANNGFQQICRRFGLQGTTTQILQINAFTGLAAGEFVCTDIAAPPWTPGLAVLIRPSATATGRIPGVECTQNIALAQDGVPIFAGANAVNIPVTFAGNDPEDICDHFGIPLNGGQVTTIEANLGNVEDHLCQTAPQTVLRLGEGALVYPTVPYASVSLVIY